MSSPTSRPPGVPDTGGTAKYAVLAVVLVLGIGAIFAWRSFSTPAVAPAPVASVPSVTASAEPPPNPKLDDIPLPLPVEEKPEAGSGTRVVSGPVPANAGCEATCVGSAPPELAGALQVRGMQARHRCYERALLQNSSLRGHVTLAVRVGPSGNVCSATVTSNDMGSPAVASCAAGLFQSSGGLPAPHGGCVTASVPISFVPQGQ